MRIRAPSSSHAHSALGDRARARRSILSLGGIQLVGAHAALSRSARPRAAVPVERVELDQIDRRRSSAGYSARPAPREQNAGLPDVVRFATVTKGSLHDEATRSANQSSARRFIRIDRGRHPIRNRRSSPSSPHPETGCGRVDQGAKTSATCVALRRNRRGTLRQKCARSAHHAGEG